jgi:hypothetical protein
MGLAGCDTTKVDNNMKLARVWRLCFEIVLEKREMAGQELF